jgi:hypothetical protein
MCAKQEGSKITTDNPVSPGCDLKLSCKMKLVDNKFEKWLNISSMHSNHGKATATNGKIHNYLGMELSYRKRKEN